MLLPALLKTAASVKKIVASAATETLKQACAYMHDSRVLLHLSIAVNEKNSPALRLRAIQGLRAFIAAKGKLDPTGMSILQKACADPDPEVRLEAAILVEECLDQRTKDVLLDKLDINARRQLWRTIERYQKSKELQQQLQPPIVMENKENSTTPVKKLSVTPLKKGIFTPTRIALGTPPVRKLAPFIRKPSELSQTTTIQLNDSNCTNSSSDSEVEQQEEMMDLEDKMEQETKVTEKTEQHEDDNIVMEKMEQERTGAMDMEITQSSEDEEITIKVTTTSSVFQIKPPIQRESQEKQDAIISKSLVPSAVSSSIYTTPVKSSTNGPSPRLTPKSTSKVPLRVRLGLATCSPYQQQLAALESSTPTKNVVPLRELLQLFGHGDQLSEADDMEYLQRLCRALEKSEPSIDESMQILEILSSLLHIPNTDSQLLLASKIVCMLTERSVHLLEILDELESKNRQIFTEIIGQDILQSFPAHVLRDYVKLHPKVNHFRAHCFQAALSDQSCVREFIRDCALILKTSLNDPVISTRQAVALCFKGAAGAMAGFENVLTCFVDLPLSNLERRLAETYCQIK